jgi:hypothetical protein
LFRRSVSPAIDAEASLRRQKRSPTTTDGGRLAERDTSSRPAIGRAGTIEK